MDNLDKKSILVTGGATGLGFAMAKRFSEKGAFVTICGRRKEKIDEAISNLKVNSIGIVADVTNEEDRDRICNLLSERGVLNRPFWRPISKMVPRFEPADTPNADFICSRGINLPCATKLNEEDISYASTVINDVINGE